MIDRRARPRSTSKGKNKKPARSIVRNLSVIDFHPSSPQEFTRQSTTLVASGMVELNVDGNKCDVRQSNAAVIQSCELCGDIGCDDFQFVKRTGHSFRVPNVAPGFRFDADAVKALTGQGELCVRLTKPVHIPSDDNWSENDDFLILSPRSSCSVQVF